MVKCNRIAGNIIHGKWQENPVSCATKHVLVRVSESCEREENWENQESLAIFLSFKGNASTALLGELSEVRTLCTPAVARGPLSSDGCCC